MKRQETGRRRHLDLGHLPRADASPEFTAAVLDRVRQSRQTRPLPRLGTIAAGALVVISSAAGGMWWSRRAAPEPPPLSTERIDELRLEYRELSDELESLRRLAEDSQPFVPVSVSPETQILFDLRDIQPLPVRHAANGRRVR